MDKSGFTSEGHYYQTAGLMQEGILKCAGVVSPSSNIPSVTHDVFDAIVIGAGYAGLTACRDLCNSGFKTLLLEARDRVGGRTWTAEVEGHLYEMGGTWIHWNQPHTYREISRYNYVDLQNSKDSQVGCNYFTLDVDGKRRNMPYEEEVAMADKAFKTFCDVDGQGGRSVLPLPHNSHSNMRIKKWEKMSAAQRLAEITSELSSDEQAILQAFTAAISGASMNDTGFFDVLRWWALSGYSTEGLYDLTETYKIRKGQSDFARQFFDEALQTRLLSYAFNTHVAAVQDSGDKVIVKSKQGGVWAGKRLVCTIPLNVLHETLFSPPLRPEKIAASRKGHVNQGAKIHLEAHGDNLRTWSGVIWPASRIFTLLGDGITPAGNTHLVCFGSNKHSVAPEEDAREIVFEAEQLHDMVVKKVLWHNWSADPLSRGTWCMFSPDFSFEYLDVLRERQGNIIFASADWALGWRGFIDGAIQEGTRAAFTILRELGPPRNKPASL